MCLRTLLFVAVVLLTLHVNAATVNVLVLNGGTGSAFASGGRYSGAFNDMSNAALFGTGTGIVNYGFNFTEVTSLTPTDLQNADLLILTQQASLFGPTQIGYAYDFVNSGGRLLAIGSSLGGNGFGSNDPGGANRRSLPQALTGRFMQDFTTNYSSSSYIKSSGSLAIVAAPGTSPFGTNAGSLINRTANLQFGSATGNTGTFALGTSNVSGTLIIPDGLFGTVGNGRFLLMGSINAFGTETVNGTTLTSQYGTGGANQQFFRNSVAWLTDGAATAVPEPSSIAVLSLGLAAAGWLRLGRRKNVLS